MEQKREIVPIETERLLLRPFVREDLGAFYLIFHDEEVNTFLPWFPLHSLQEAEIFLQQRFSNRSADQEQYAICVKDGDPIGYVTVCLEDSYDLGYGLRKEYWHQGFVTEACQAIVTRCKQRGIPYLTATHDVHNPRSGAVMKRLGMQYQYSYEEMWQPKNKLVTFRMYQLWLNGGEQYRKYWDISSVRYVEKQV